MCVASTSLSISSLLKSFMLNGVAHCVKSWTVCTQYLQVCTNKAENIENNVEHTSPHEYENISNGRDMQRRQDHEPKHHRMRKTS